MPDAFRRLQENGIAASLRENREGRKFLRFSPHCYNTESDFERVFAALGKG
jgi:selenocysteine lyase/cysteine desulfurase